MKRNPITGIDEAGRGPLFGPMVMAAVVLNERQQETLAKAGVRDSKQLTARQRNELVPTIKGTCINWSTREVSPAEIDAENLNLIEARVTASLLREVGASRAIIDVPTRGRGIGRYLAMIQHFAGPAVLRLEGANHADERFIPVAAASILAKVQRDAALHHLRLRYGDIGSGYPSDPKTRAFLDTWIATHGELPPFARRKWRPAKQAMAQR